MLEGVRGMFYNRAADGGVTSTGRQPDQSSRKGAFMAIEPVSPSVGDSQSNFQCKRCGEVKNAHAFYASDKGRCKECIKARVRANRLKNIDYYRGYDRKRYRESDDRKAAARKSAQSPAGIRSKVKSNERRRQEEPEKFRARHAVANGIRDGKIERGTECFFCGATGKLHAHHQDYSKPLDIFWLCAPCHGKLHTINGDLHRPHPDQGLSS